MKYDLKSQLTIQEGTKADYFILSNYHYLSTPLPPVKKIYTIRPKPDDPRKTVSGFTGLTGGHASLIGIIAYSSALLYLRARTKATRGFFEQPGTITEKLKLLNDNVLYVSRLIIDPRYRRLGLADWLWRETLKLQTVPMVESLTPLPVRKEWLERMGFKVSYNPTPQSLRKLKNAFLKAKIHPNLWDLPEEVQKRINALLTDEKIRLDRSLHDFLHNYRTNWHNPSELKRLTYILSKIPYPNGYLVWFNPHIGYNPILNWINGQHVTLNPNIGYVKTA